MSLETKIEALTVAVLALTERLDSLRAPAQDPAPPWEKAEKVEPKTEKAEKPKPEKAEKTKSSIEPEKITAQDLMRMCLEMVRVDRSKKDVIKKIISSYGGKTIAEVDPVKYPALKSELEGLV